MSVADVMQAVAESDLDLDVVAYLAPILQSIYEPTEEEEARIKDIKSQLATGLSELRSELGMPWDLVPHNRIIELANQMADFASEWNVYDTYLLGTFMAASARAQLTEGQPQPQASQLDQVEQVASLAVSANNELSGQNRKLAEQIEQADKIGAMAKKVVAGIVPPNELLREALTYAHERGL